MKTRSTIIGSRHYAHKNNVPTEEGLQIVEQNTQAIADQFQGKYESVNITGTDKERTGGTAKEIANTLGLEINEEQVKDWLSCEPQHGPLKETYKKLCEYYNKDENVKKQGYSDEFVDKMQHNQLDGVDSNKLGVFNATKLYNITSYLSKNPEQTDTLNIAGIHGGFFRESILYTIRGDSMPTERKGQIKMGENFILKVIQDDKGEPGLSVDYRGVSKTTPMSKMKESIDALK